MEMSVNIRRMANLTEIVILGVNEICYLEL